MNDHKLGRMIFHHPYPVALGGTVGSEVRPAQMLNAFKQLGFEVEAVTGFAPERQKAMQKVLARLQKGEKFDFVYSESINKPMLLAERMHLGQAHYTNKDYFKWLLRNSLLLDFNFFQALRQHHLPIGWFCRDIYWRFEFYRQRPFWQRHFHTALYQYDWRRFKQLVTHLFLPDDAMQQMLPVVWPAAAVSALPPGTIMHSLTPRPAADATLRLFYVGGVVPPNYNLTPGIEALRDLDGVSLTICCRSEEWQRWRDYYHPPLNVTIVHEKGRVLDSYYQTADLFYMVRDSFEYLKYTMPIKVFEALGYGLPIVTLPGTAAADFIAAHDVGWVVSASELPPLLQHLRQHPAEIKHKRAQVVKVGQENSWLKRAETAAHKLLAQ